MKEYKTLCKLTCISSAKLLELKYFLLGSASKTYANAVRASTPGKFYKTKKNSMKYLNKYTYQTDFETNDFHHLDDVYIVQLIGSRND